MPRESRDAARARPAPVAILALVIANVALACGPWLVRLAGTVSHVGPIGAAFWRLALALPVLLLAMRASGERLPRPATRLMAATALAGLLFAGDLALWHLGIFRTRLANATLLGNVTAVLFPVYGFFVMRRWPTGKQAAALMLAAAGAVLLVGRSYQLSSGNIGGDLLCIAAGLCYTGYLVAVDRARRGLGPLATLAGAGVAGVPVLLVAALALEGSVRPHAWAPLVLLAIGSQLIGQGLILWAVARVQPLVVGVTLLIQPLVAAGIGWLVYRERLGPTDLLGAGAVAAAVLLVRDAGPRLPAADPGLSG